MIHRAYALSSMTEAFNQECTRLLSIFTRLNYPLTMINSSITKTIQSFFIWHERERQERQQRCASEFALQRLNII